MNHKIQKDFIVQFIFYLSIFILFYITVRYLIYIFLPFLLGVMIAFILGSTLRRLNIKIKGIFLYLILFILYFLLIAVITYLFIMLSIFLRQYIGQLPNLYAQQIEPLLYQLGDFILSLFNQFDDDMQRFILNQNVMFQKQSAAIIASSSFHLLKGLSNVVKIIPNLLFSLLLMIITSFLCIKDDRKIRKMMIRWIPKRYQTTFLLIKKIIIEKLFVYIKAYIKIMLITFIELVVGFIVLGIPHPLALACFISIFDILPLLGCGGIMIPWIFILFLMNQKRLATGLLILYLIITLVRNVIEPHIIGKDIGVHPFMMLLVMFIGLRFFGTLGFILLPMSFIVAKEVYYFQNNP
ncbi:MAG: AI-2E family transporter [Erysipelotrichaceae bacterium]